jgi:hypothetical protein
LKDAVKRHSGKKIITRIPPPTKRQVPLPVAWRRTPLRLPEEWYQVIRTLSYETALSQNAIFLAFLAEGLERLAGRRLNDEFLTQARQALYRLGQGREPM